MITTLGIPVLNRGDFLLRCVTSVDHPVENLVIINNSEGKNAQVTAACSQIERREIANASLFDNIKIETKKNLGCGPSWNYIFKNNPGPWLISGSDIMFLPGMASSSTRTNIESSRRPRRSVHGLTESHSPSTGSTRRGH